MPATMSPHNILKLWLKAVKLQDGKRKPTDFPKKVRDQKLKIKNGLTKLKVQATKDLTNPTNQQVFVKTRDQLAKVMMLYIRYLKTTRDEDRRTLPRYLKTVMRLTALVKALDPAQIDPNAQDEGEPSLENLEGVQTDAVEQALAQPEVSEEEEADDLGTEEVMEETVEEAAETAEEKAPPPPDPQAQWTRRRKELEPLMLSAFKEKRGDLVKLKAAFDYAQQKAQQGDYNHALAGLDVVEKLLQQAATVAPGTTASPAETNDFPQLWKAAENAWKAAVETIDGQIAQLQKALRESGFEELKEIAEFGFNGVTGNFRVPLAAAFRNVEAAQGEARHKEIAKARIIVAGFKKHLASSELVLVCDENPFDVPVTIRATLGPVLDQLESVLEKA